MGKTARFPGYFYGQKLEVVGKPTVKVIGRFSQEYVLNYQSIRVLSEGKNLINQTIFLRYLFDTRGRIERFFGQTLPEPEASLFSDIVL